MKKIRTGPKAPRFILALLALMIAMPLWATGETGELLMQKALGLPDKTSAQALQLFYQAAAAYTEQGDRAQAGVAYALAQDFGQAQLSFLRALQSQPCNPEALSNVELLRGKVSDGSGPLGPAAFWLSIPLRLVFYALILAAASAALVIAGINYYRRARFMSPLVWILSSITGVLSLLVLLAIVLTPPQAVVTQKTEVYRGDSAAFAEAAGSPLLPGREVLVGAQRTGWVYITWGEGHRGWIPQTALQRVDEPD